MHTFRRAQTILNKGPEHVLNLGWALATRAAQRASGTWAAEQLSEAAFLRQLQVRGTAATVARHFRERIAPVFFFSVTSVPEVVKQVESTTQAATLARADEILRHTFHFRGQPPIAFNGQIDWLHKPAGNTDWTWELNRHAYFVTLGRAWAYSGAEKYVAGFTRLLTDWMARFPPSVGAPNWNAPLEVAFRINVWVWAFYHFRAALSDEHLLTLLRGLWWHLRFMAANLEYASPNNHLLLQAKALAFGSLLFPELRPARRWLALGQRVLWREVCRQVHPDGVHAEQAPLYHRIILSELLELEFLLERNHQRLPEAVQTRVRRMVEFEQAALWPNGDLPLWGDSALEDTYARYHPLRPTEANAWLGYTPPSGAPGTSRAFPQGGYYFMRAAAPEGESYVGFDCGPFAYPRAPGHGHADALSFEFYARGQAWLVDAGVYSYHLGQNWRRYFRGTAAHNTVLVDEQDQTHLLDGWRVLRPARATRHLWLTHAVLDFVDGEHDGYTRLPQPITHRRQLFFIKPHCLIVRDVLTGVGTHTFSLNFHLAPEAQPLMANEGLVRVHHPSGEGLLMASLPPAGTETRILDGATEPIQGWVSRYSGEKQAAPVVSHTVAAAAPVEFLTVLLAEPASAHRQLRLERLTMPEGSWGLRVHTDTWHDTLVLGAVGPRHLAVSDCTVNAPLAYWRTFADGELWRVALPDGGEWQGLGVQLAKGQTHWEKLAP